MIHKTVKIGSFCVIADDAEIGEGTVIQSYVEIRSGTIIGKNCYIDSGVKFSGKCKIGNNVTLRYDTIIARGVDVGDGSYLCPRVMTNNLNTEEKQIGGAKIGTECFIGTHSVLQHGIEICDDTVIGSMSFVNKSITEAAKYVGIPAKKI